MIAAPPSPPSSPSSSGDASLIQSKFDALIASFEEIEANMHLSDGEYRKLWERLALHYQGKFTNFNIAETTGLNIRSAVRDEKNTDFEHRWERLVDDNDGMWKIRKEEGQRYKHTEGLFFVISPEVEQVKIFDCVCAIDYLYRFKSYFRLVMLCATAGNVLTVVAVPLSPLVWLHVTDMDTMLFVGNETSLGNDTLLNGNGTTSPRSPLPSGLLSFSTIVLNMLCACASFVFANLASSPSFHATPAVEDKQVPHLRIA